MGIYCVHYIKQKDCTVYTVQCTAGLNPGDIWEIPNKRLMRCTPAKQVRLYTRGPLYPYIYVYGWVKSQIWSLMVKICWYFSGILVCYVTMQHRKALFFQENNLLLASCPTKIAFLYTVRKKRIISLWIRIQILNFENSTNSTSFWPDFFFFLTVHI